MHELYDLCAGEHDRLKGHSTSDLWRQWNRVLQNFLVHSGTELYWCLKSTVSQLFWLLFVHLLQSRVPRKKVLSSRNRSHQIGLWYIFRINEGCERSWPSGGSATP